MDRLITLHEQELLVRVDDYISRHFTEEIDAAFLLIISSPCSDGRPDCLPDSIGCEMPKRKDHRDF